METKEPQRALLNPNSTVVDELTKVEKFYPRRIKGTSDSAILALVRDVLGSFSKTFNVLDSKRQGPTSRFDPMAQSTEKSWCGRRRIHPYESTKVLRKTMNDGYAWRKYGQKEILNFKHPRSYFRCAHKYDRSCPATRQVQIWGEDPSLLEITYIGEHTCRDLGNSSIMITDVVESNTTMTNHNVQHVPPFSSSSSSSAYPSKEASPSTFPVLPDAVGFDPATTMAQLASSASTVLPGWQSSGGSLDANFDEEFLEFQDILSFDYEFGFF